MVASARTKDGLIELWRRVVDPEYARSIEEADDAGKDVVEMQASQLSALDAQQLVVQQSYYLLPHSDQQAPPASAAVRSVGTVAVTRLDSGRGPRTIKAGVQLEGHVIDSMGVDRVNGFYRVVADVTLAEGDVGPVNVAVEAVVPGFAGNQPAGTITTFKAGGRGILEVLVTSITTVEDTQDPDLDVFNVGETYQFLLVEGLGVESYPRLITNIGQGTPNVATVDPPLPASAFGNTYLARVFDLAELFSVVQSAPTTGGRDGMLDEIGRERNRPRSSGESDDAYRVRLSKLDDTISPNAILRLATRILQPLGIRFHIEEVRDEFLGFILDRSPLDEGVICSQMDPWASSVLLSENDSVRFFVICVSAPDGVFDPSTPFDSVFDGVNAYDAGGPGDGSFGVPLSYTEAISLLWRSVNGARLAGVNFVIAQDPDL